MKKIINGEYLEMAQDEYRAWKKEIDENHMHDEPSAEELLSILTGEAET